MILAERNHSNEKAVWEAYLKKCERDGTKPSAKDFAAWAKSLLAEL